MAAKPTSPQRNARYSTPKAAPRRSADSTTGKIVGPILEAERCARLAGMTDEEAQRASRRVLELWQPDWHGDDGAELLGHQRVFARTGP